VVINHCEWLAWNHDSHTNNKLHQCNFKIDIMPFISFVYWQSHQYFILFVFLLTETSIFSVEGVFLYPEGRPCAVKTWKFQISTECLPQLRRNEALQLLDDSHQALCLIGKVVHHREYPLNLLETSSSGTIATLLPSLRVWEGNFWWERNLAFILINAWHRCSLLLTPKLIMT